MRVTENNFAYIDGANLHKGVGTLGWHLDYKKSILAIRKEKTPDADETA